MGATMIEASKFERVYRQLLYLARKKYPDVEPTFTSGFWNEEEGYKLDFWDKARASLELDTWPDHRNDPMYIISKSTQPFGVQMTDSSRLQNLVSYENYSKLFEIFSVNPREAAASIYDVFFGSDEEAAFNRFAKLLSKKSMNDPLSIASLYFFLKDKDRYVTARKQGTGERLERLGLSAACVQACTWKGYQQYLSIIHELHTMLLPSQPDATLLDAQSFLWMLWMINSDTPEYTSTSPRILFCNIAWMESYDHIHDPTDKPRHGGSYVAETGSAFESWNFHRYDDGIYYGFVETKYTGETAVEENAKQLHIEKIISGAKDAVDGVTVIFCAHSDKNGGTVIVGWYENATVLRNRKKCYDDSHAYNITAKKAILLPEILRTKTVPRARKGGVGFGQSNVWYAQDADDIVQNVLTYINSFESKGAVQEILNRTIEAMSDDELLRECEESSTPAPTYTATATLRKRNPVLPEIAKRRAKGVCQLCGENAPFTDKNGRPYLEAHHIIPLAEDGADALSNMVALCPNCHRKMHALNLPEDVEKLRKAVN